jgi:hypothetical protein
MKNRVFIHVIVLLALSIGMVGQQIPPGTVVPVMLETTLDAVKTKSDKKIEGRVMQDVLLSGRQKIKERSRISGHVVDVARPGASGSALTVRFDVISDDGRTIPITAALLAVASENAVSEAQSPINLTSDRDPMTQWTTRQVGGDIVNRAVGKAGSKKGVSGTWLGGTSVAMKLTANPTAGCNGGTGYDEEQSLWVFSSDACGVYGLKGVTIERSGKNLPSADIVLKSNSRLQIGRGSGWLLIAIESH